MWSKSVEMMWDDIWENVCGRRKRGRTFSDTAKWFPTHHVFGHWYIMRSLPRNARVTGPDKFFRQFIWFLVNDKDFSAE